MKTIGWLIAAVGGYYILEQMGILPNPFGTSVATPVTTSGNPTSTGGQTATTTNTNSSTTPVSTTTQNNTLNAIVVAMQKNNDDPTAMHTVWEYNYYYQQVRNVAGPDPNMLFPNNANASTEQFSLSEWWSAMNGIGLSGMGTIAHFVNPYANPMGTPFGSYLLPQGSETYIKSFN